MTWWHIGSDSEGDVTLVVTVRWWHIGSDSEGDVTLVVTVVAHR